MGLKHLLLCLWVPATCAVKIDISEKTPENNPDLNKMYLGTLQDAWEAIGDAAKEYYYVVYVTLAHTEYTSLKCKRLRTYRLNDTAKSAYYTLSWHGKTWRTNGGITVTWNGDVRALTQGHYEVENVLRYWYYGTYPERFTNNISLRVEHDRMCSDWTTRIQTFIAVEEAYVVMHAAEHTLRSACPPHTGIRAPNGSYNLLDYVNDYCNHGIADPWRMDKINQSDLYVVFRQPSCYVTRQLAAKGTCEFWLSESHLNKTLEDIDEKKFSDKDVANSTEGANSTQATTKKSTSIRFHRLPHSCRLAFLFSCGYPTAMTYYKEVCDKINKTEIPQN